MGRGLKCGISLSVHKTTSHWAIVSHTYASIEADVVRHVSQLRHLLQQKRSKVPLRSCIARANASFEAGHVGQSSLEHQLRRLPQKDQSKNNSGGCSGSSCGCCGGCWRRKRLLQKRRLRQLLLQRLLLGTLRIIRNKNICPFAARAYASIGADHVGQKS